jgi:hypothetical protein
MLAHRLLLIGSLLLFPVYSQASSCTGITEQIAHDTMRYGDTLSQHPAPWMCLAWLQQKLGPGHTQHISDTQIRHTWTCDREDNTVLTVLTDQNGQLLQVEGHYNAARGAAAFSQAVNGSCPPVSNPTKMAPKAQAVPVTANPVAANPVTANPVTANPVTTTSVIANPTVANKVTTNPINTNNTQRVGCDVIAEQIYDIATIATKQPYSHLPFPWESKKWLLETFGKPTPHTTNKVTYYTWHCERNEMTTIAYSETQPGTPQQLTTLCKGSNCYLAAVSRINDTLRGTLKTIAPNPG